MPLDVTKLATLKRLMMQEEDIVNVMRYFLDHLSEDPDFTDQSVPAHHPQLQAIIPQVGAELFGFEGLATMRYYLLLQIPGQQFYHGACMLNDKMIAFIYFDDIRTGCLGAVTSLNAPTEFARFSTSTPTRQGQAPQD